MKREECRSYIVTIYDITVCFYLYGYTICKEEEENKMLFEKDLSLSDVQIQSILYFYNKNNS
jgi:hypothetical protein